MKFLLSLLCITFLPLLSPAGVPASGAPLCASSDADCITFQQLAGEEQFEKIVGMLDAKKKYSEESRALIGKAYLALAGREENTPEQEEAYCRKALDYGQNQAYMGLYFLNVQKDPKAALDHLRKYLTTKPGDPVPYVILGEAELDEGHYREADTLLRESKKVGKARSARVDWLLFQANYLMKEYTAAGELLGSALGNGSFEKDLKILLADKRYAGIEDRPEFRKHREAFARARAL